MAYKLKLDDAGHVVLTDGKPVYVDETDGKELAFDAAQMHRKITELGAENKAHRERFQAAESVLEKFGGAKPEDFAAMKKVMEEVGGIDGISELKKKSGVDVEAIKKSITDAYEAKLAEATKASTEKDGTIRQLLVGNGFATAKSLADTIFKDTRDVAESYFGKHFKVENGKPVAYLGENMLLSRERPGEPADVNEALSILIDQHPQRDSFRLAPGGGSGAKESRASVTGIKARSDFKTDADKSKFISENGLDAFKALPAQ